MSHRRAKKLRAKMFGNVKSVLANPGTRFVLDAKGFGTGHYVTNTARHAPNSERRLYQLFKKMDRPNVRT